MAYPVGRLPALPRPAPGRGLPSLSPACPAFSLLPCPLSPSPFPNGEGEIYGYFMQGALPLASPGLSPSGAGSRGEPLAQRGACPVGRLPTLPPLSPAGGLLFLSPAYPAFSLLPCPLSPNPFPNGEGEIYGYFMQGAPPLASPGLSPSGAGSRGEPLAQRGACPVGRLPTLPPLYPAGGLPSLPLANPALSFLPCPLSPARARRALFPGGEGG